MYAYRFCLLFLYFYNISKTLGTSDQQTPNVVVTYELKKLEEHGHTNVQDDLYSVKKYVFNPGNQKTVEKVVYDGESLWTKSTDGKTFKQLEAYEKENLLQLVHLKLTNETADEDSYYKKVKKNFVKLADLSEYTKLKETLFKSNREFVDETFPLDLHNKDLYLRFYRDKYELFDGVWRRSLTPTNGRAYLARYGEQKLWDLDTDSKQLGTVKEFDFGEDNKLLELSLHGGVKKYFSKLNGTTTWTTLSDESQFNTKATELKSRYFETPLEYDLAKKPDLTKFVLQLKSEGGNASDLTLMPVRNYYVNKVRYNDKVLWTSNRKEERVAKLRLFLLGYEVHLVQLHVVNSPQSLEFRAEVFYLQKENEVFNKKDKTQYGNALKSVKSKKDTTQNFVYKNDWLATNAPLDLSRYNPAEWTVEKEDLTNGLFKETLTPKEGMTFTSLSYLGQPVFPNSRRTCVDPLFKNLYVYYKKGLLQLVHLKGTRTVDKGKSQFDTEPFDLYLKKDKDDFLTLTQDQLEEYVKLLKDPSYFVDKYVHLDLSDENLNENFFTVTKELVDGVNTKMVKSNDVRVTRLTYNDFEFWKQTPQYKDKFVVQYDLYSVSESKLLAVHFNTVTSRVFSKVYFEKVDQNTQWSELTDRTFTQALASYKAVSSWDPVELDVSVKPLTTLFDVTVNPLKGNRTELVLKPLSKKRVTKVNFGQTNLWTSANSNRVSAVYLYLEAYDPKFLVLDVLTPGRLDTTTKTEVKRWKDTSGFVTTNEFDVKLKTFKDEDNRSVFTYNPSWQLPSEEFDPVSFSFDHFEFKLTQDGVLESKKYVAKPGTVVKKVTFDGAKVWPLDETPNTTKKLVSLEVFSKDGLVQLLVLHNKPLQGSDTLEDLYFKKVVDRFEKVELRDFTELKNKLKTSETYVDDNVKLDLSTDVSTDLFKTETTLEDGLEKEVMELKVGKLYEVKASPPLWTSQDGSYVQKLERYTLDDSQLLVLYVTDKSGNVTKQYFQKSLTTPAEPDTPAPAAPQAPSESQQQPSQPAAQKPSFTTMGDKSEFFKKLNTAKESVHHTEVTLNLDSYKNKEKFRVLESDYGRAKLYKLYPLPTFWVTQLNSGDKKLWEKEETGSRMVEACVYLHDGMVKLVSGVVWPKDRVDDTKDKTVYFQLNAETNQFDSKEKTEFDTALEQVKTTAPVPIPVESGGMLPLKSREFKKLFVSDVVDPSLFDSTSETNGEHTVRRLTAKDNVFVNLLETKHGVLWKAEQATDLWKDATFSLKNDTGHAVLTLSENSVEKLKYYKFERERWTSVSKEAYDALNAKVGVTGSAGVPDA